MAKVISKETMTVGILAVVAGLAAAYGVRTYMIQEEAAPPAQEKVAAAKIIRLPVASQDLPADRVITRGDLVELPMTMDQIKARFKGLDAAQTPLSRAGIIGRRLAKPLAQGQPFSTTGFYLEGSTPSISKKLQPGYRAIRIAVSDTHEAGVQPGMHVDVVFRATAHPAKAGQPAIPEKTLTLLHRVEVINAERPDAKATTKKPMLFTLAVPEDKADMFGVIEGRGEVWLVPTPAKDKDGSNNSGSAVANAETLAGLLGLKVTKPVPPFETDIYRRGHIQVNKFVDGKLLARHSIDAGTSFDEEVKPPKPAIPAVRPRNESPTPQIERVPAGVPGKDD
jgi:Flp pilus assembly protein CpaB